VANGPLTAAGIALVAAGTVAIVTVAGAAFGVVARRRSPASALREASMV